MEILNKMHPDAGVCAICGNRKAGAETWFLITEKRWEDGLNVWKYDAIKARGASARALCGPRHVRELVVHWMTTGCLQYPFASSSRTALNRGSNPNRESDLSALSGKNDHRKTSAQLCEIAVDREGIVRALRDDPLSLNTILDEMMIVLESEIDDDGEEDFESDDRLALLSLE